ncbi:hypothetical protein BH11PSE12_BH11PSE12_32890 [soil metagenome]
MIFKRLLSVAALGLGMCAYATAGGGAKAVDNTYINWSWPSLVSKMEVDMTALFIPPVGTPSFLSNEFQLWDASNNYVAESYIGFQHSYRGSNRRAVLFSIWDATGASAGAGGICQPFGGEGIGQQCFIPYDWVAGKSYRMRVVHDSGLNFSGYVIDLSTTPPTETLIGQIQAPAQNSAKTSGAPVGIAGSMSQWVEHYVDSPGACSNIAYTKVVRGQPFGNGGAVQPTPGKPKYAYYINTDDLSYPARCHNLGSWSGSGTDSYMEQGNPGTSSAQQLVAASGKFVYATYTTVTMPKGTIPASCGGAGLKSDSTGARDCSQITRVALPGGKVALQVDNGYYLSCTDGGGSTVTASSHYAGDNESFAETTVSGKVYYQSINGKYLTAASSGDLRCDGADTGANQGFTSLSNVAPSASVTVSSESAATGQQGIKAIDGVVGGFPKDQTKEWVTNGEGVGGWIQLNWSTPVNVSAVTLYDRPNTGDQILAGTLFFSDGSSVAVGALPNDGVAGLSVTFPSRSISWIKFRADQTSSSNIGLAEFQVWAGSSITVKYSVGGIVSGLSGTGLQLQNGSDVLNISANGSYAFPIAMQQGNTYQVTVKAQPSGQSCTVSNASGTVGAASITNINVSCAALWVCKGYTATNAAHKTAARATTKTSLFTTTYYAVGSSQSMGTSGTTNTSLKEDPQGYFAIGQCPAQPVKPVINTVSSPLVKIVGVSGADVQFEVSLSGTASDANNDIDKVRFDLISNGALCTGTTSFSCTLQIPASKTSLPMNLDNLGQVSATDKTSLNSAAYLIAKLTLPAPSAPVINTLADPIVNKISEDATSVQFDVSVTGTASDPDSDVNTVSFAIGADKATCTGTTSFTCVVRKSVAKTSLPQDLLNVGAVTATDKTGLVSADKIVPKITLSNTVALACFKATNSAHKTAARATSKTVLFTTTYYANGTNDNLGTSGITNTVLQETAAGSGSWKKITACP